MISAEEFARAGFPYIGRKYSEMDCQSFFERCASDCGLVMDLPGSNAWYRKFLETGWAGSPEECKRRFGYIPNGAALFIHAFDGGEIKRGYNDGLGNASHIGIKTGTGQGAIHSSASRGCVAESTFKDKTIPNGGWNMVGLSSLFDYGDVINKAIQGGGDTDPPWDDSDEGGESVSKTATVTSLNGNPVHMRNKKETGGSGIKLYDDLPVGTVVEVVERGSKWTKVNYGTRKGWWIMSKFLVFDSDTPDEDTPDGSAPTEDDEEVAVSFSADEAAVLLSAFRILSDKLGEQIGRG